MHTKWLAAAGTIAFFGFLTLSSADADALVGNFIVDNGSPSASGGQVTFTLNGDGTIAASLSTTLAGSIIGFGFDSIGTDLPESGFSPTAPDNANGWDDSYGSQFSGFFCSACGTTESWTIGNTGDFTSVFQALGGGNSTFDFFLLDANGDEWAGDAIPITEGVPEPLTLSLFSAGFAGVIAIRRGSMVADLWRRRKVKSA